MMTSTVLEQLANQRQIDVATRASHHLAEGADPRWGVRLPRRDHGRARSIAPVTP
jgi:hypothetical protein